eukprot:scaffold5_cov169-Amphora_coffeaeformis.AAC.3
MKRAHVQYRCGTKKSEANRSCTATSIFASFAGRSDFTMGDPLASCKAAVKSVEMIVVAIEHAAHSGMVVEMFQED